jgi:hypothetical protein
MSKAALHTFCYSPIRVAFFIFYAPVGLLVDSVVLCMSCWRELRRIFCKLDPASKPKKWGETPLKQQHL